MTKDPICGMTVDEATALHAERDGVTRCFCSEHCRTAFLSAPAASNHEGMKELKPTGKALYTCPMHPEVQQDHAGNCPKCGMALEPTATTAIPVEGEGAGHPRGGGSALSIPRPAP